MVNFKHTGGPPLTQFPLTQIPLKLRPFEILLSYDRIMRVSLMELKGALTASLSISHKPNAKKSKVLSSTLFTYMYISCCISYFK